MLNLNIIHLLMLCGLIIIVIIGIMIYIFVKSEISDSFHPVYPSFSEIVEKVYTPIGIILTIIKDETLFLCNLRIHKIDGVSEIEYTIKYKKIAVNIIKKVDDPYMSETLISCGSIFISEPTKQINNTQDTLLFLKIILSDEQQLELEKHIFSVI